MFGVEFVLFFIVLGPGVLSLTHLFVMLVFNMCGDLIAGVLIHYSA